MNVFLRKSLDRGQPNRRDFMVQSTCAGLGITSVVNTLAHLQLMGAASAQSAGSDYKALVCVFLNGGMDTNNLLIPLGGTARSHYESGRGVPQYAGGSGGIAVPLADIAAAGTQLAPVNAVSSYEHAAGYIGTDGSGNPMALHPGAAHLKTMFAAGDLGVLANVGVLTQPNVTRANFSTLPVSQRPPQLFSHSDQQRQWQSSIPDRPFTSGWGGRLADLLDGIHNMDPTALAMGVSVAGVNSFQVGLQQQPYVMSAAGVSNYSGFGTNYTNGLLNLNTQPFTGYNVNANPGTTGSNYRPDTTGWRLSALEQILGMTHESLFDNAYASVAKNARVTEGLVGSALAMTAAANNTTTLDTHFSSAYAGSGINGLTDNFAQQMRMVARLIAGNSVLKNKRQIFFVQLGGWDTHTSQIPELNGAARTDQGFYRLMLNLSCGIKAFRDSLVATGLWNNVLAFTASDFTRTFTPNKTDQTGGSDHGWGGHMMVAGGSVRGGRIFGQFPNLTVNGGMDVSGNRGRWIPTTSVDQYAAVIAKWLGVGAGEMGAILPNLGRFNDPFAAGSNLDFMNYG